MPDGMESAHHSLLFTSQQSSRCSDKYIHFAKMASYNSFIVLPVFIMIIVVKLFNAADEAGSLNQCGDETSANDNAGTKWNYKFHCKDGDMCYNNKCQHCNNTEIVTFSPDSSGHALVAAQCKETNVVVERCKENFCDKNFDLNKYCGYAFTKKADGMTYYFNCEKGGKCVEGKCDDGSKVLITKCNKANMDVNAGKCWNQAACMDVQCSNVAAPAA